MSEGRDDQWVESLLNKLLVSTDDKVGKAAFLDLIPKIEVFDKAIECNGHRLNLVGKPMSMKIFKVFLQRQGVPITKEELLRQVYGDVYVRKFSGRYLEIAAANLVKMISRVRTQAQRHLTHGENAGIDWFVYDQYQRTWRLFNLSVPYVRRKMKIA
jgi:hypothetical protein